MALNPMPTRTTINQSHDMAAAYRNQYPLPSGPLIETYGLLRNTRLSLFRDIDTMRAATDQFIDPDVYLELAILGGETFLATSERLGVPQNLRRFVRYNELSQLKSLRGIEPDKHLFVEGADNTARETTPRENT